jgi:eukaryotic-like serine/threonine-protein kinase
VSLRVPWRTVRLYGLTAVAGFVAAYVIVVLFVLPSDRTRGRVQTPALVGLSLEEARHVLDSVGLRFSLGEERPSPDVPRNGVLAQSPAPGTSVPRLGPVRLDVSSGPRSVRVPSVAGLTVEDARKTLADSGLSAGGVQDEASTAPRGEVLRTKPDAGRFVGEGAAVDLIVSAGPPELTMPDVIGREPSDARAVLQQLGLTRVRVDSEPGGSSGSATVVVGQQPAAGTGVRSTDRVVLRVSQRP